MLMKGGTVLEGFGKITAVAFDKTGTLTKGKPVVTDVVAYGRTEREVLSMAAALEQGSNHPLAVAILEKAKADKAPIPPAFGAKAVSGKGVEGSVGGVAVFLASAKGGGRARLAVSASGCPDRGFERPREDRFGLAGGRSSHGSDRHAGRTAG